MNFNNEFWLREAQSVAKIGYYIYDIRNDLWSSSEILDEILGIDSNYTRDSEGWLKIVHQNHCTEMCSYLKEIVELKKDFNKEYQIIRQNDKCELWVLGKGKLYYDEKGIPEILVGTIQDITEGKIAKEELQKSEERYRKLYIEYQQKEALLKSLINSIPDLIFYKDTAGAYLGCNKAFEEYANILEEELIGNTDFNVFDKETANFFRAMDLKMMEQGQPRRNEEWVNYTDGEKVLLDTLKTPYYDPEGNILGLIGISRDITEVKKKLEEIIYLSYHDTLTGLFNRRYFDEELKKIDAEEYYPLSVIMGDVNGLKIVNDALGHMEGDKLLKKVAKQIREVCGEAGIVARCGGDEFAVLLPNTSGEQAEKLCREIVDKKVEHKKIRASVSLGYATKTKLSENNIKILKEAEDMMYKNKLIEAQSYRYSIIESVTRTLYEKDHETEEHAERVKFYCRKIGESLNLSAFELNELEVFAKLHDIGKIGISEAVLQKEGKLTEEEWARLKKHSEIGFRIARAIPELSNIANYILTHHERWDGRGYPKGLKGEDIPLLSRILAVVDAYDAMTNDRPYRKAMSKGEAIEELIINSGKQFDPQVVDIFVNDILKS